MSVLLLCQDLLRSLDGTLQANIAMDEDKKEEQKKADVDRSKLEADIKAQTDLASKVGVLRSEPTLAF